MILTYQAVDQSGQETRDTVEAVDTQAAVEQLRRQGLYVTRIQGSQKRIRVSGLERTKTPRLPIKVLALTSRQMVMLLRAGTGVVPALSAIKRQMTKAPHVELFEKLIADLEGGVPLSEALRRFPRTFDATYCAIIAAGEASGSMTEMFERLSSVVGKRRAMQNKVIGALAYPALLICMSFSILLALLFFVIPRFSEMFVQLHVDPPTSTKVLLGVSDFLVAHFVLLGSVAIGGVLAAIALAVSDAGRQWCSNVQTKIPLFGPVRSKLIQAGMFQTMGTLLESGVGILEAIDLVRRSTRNSGFAELFSSLDQAVTSGGQMAPAMEESGIVEPSICQAIRTGEEAGNLGGAMCYCADVLDESNTELVNTLMRLIEPIILIGMGFVVGGVAISMFLPLFDLTAALQ